MRYMPNAVLIGDRTGGGAGLPFTSELPNGWGVRFSASPHLDAEKNHIEFGIEPDIKIDLTSLTLHDDIIEEARKTLKNMQ
jgi:C-terminal processing protease CtpA/Prc